LNRHILITDKLQIKNEILAYWEENSKAKSNLDAIVEWWMLKRKIVIVTEVVENALNDLVKEGLVRKDKNEMYSIIDQGA
jgi:predicted transcriptional regulator